MINKPKFEPTSLTAEEIELIEKLRLVKSIYHVLRYYKSNGLLNKADMHSQRAINILHVLTGAGG